MHNRIRSRSTFIVVFAAAAAVTGCSNPLSSGESTDSKIKSIKTTWADYTSAVQSKDWAAMCQQLTDAGKSVEADDAKKLAGADTPGGCETAFTQAQRVIQAFASGDPSQACAIGSFRSGFSAKVPSAATVQGCESVLQNSASGMAVLRSKGAALQAEFDKTVDEQSRSTLGDVTIAGNTATASKIPPSGGSDPVKTIHFEKVGDKWLYDARPSD